MAQDEIVIHLNSQKVEPQSCNNCFFRLFENNVNFCRRFPPFVHVTRVNKNAEGQVLGVESISIFPVMQLQGWCGEWKERG